MKHLRTAILATLLLVLAACSGQPQFYRAEKGQILLGDVPQYYIGTNFWYGAQMARENPDRLRAELDSLKALGVTNLRMLAVEPDWEGLDIALKEIRKRDMAAVLFLNNAWEWSRGFADWLEAAGQGDQPRPSTHGYGAYMKAMAAFSDCRAAQELSWEFVREIVTRYKDEPAIFSWQIANEPRCFSNNPSTRANFVKYIHETAALIKSLDPNHMVSTGNEGTMGCEGDYGLCSEVNNCKDIDYITIHIWPYNWSWVREDNVAEGADYAVRKVDDYIDQHLEMAKDYGKALVIEEFGYPRDGFRYAEGTPTTGRDKIYAEVFGRVVESAAQGGLLAGCNFWTWQIDPPQEAQGLNSVFISDRSTVGLIKDATIALAHTAYTYVPIGHQWLFFGEGPFRLDARVSSPVLRSATVQLNLVRDLSLMSDVRDTVRRVCASTSLKKGKAAAMSLDLGDLEPGFYQVNLTGCRPFNIGVNPEQISSPQDKQPDFDAFWERTLAELAAVEPEYSLTPMPEYSNSDRNLYKVEMKSLGGVTVGGYLAEPVKEGKYPVFIDYMGYGAEPFVYDPSGAPESIEFLLSVRDQGIFKNGQSRWIDRGLESKEDFYYRGAFCDVVRAIDFVCSLDKADKDNIFSRGESQGGAFTWISASLDHRIKGITPAVPFLTDYEDYGRIVQWPVWEVYETADAQGLDRAELLKTLSYFDVKNFVDRIQCPVYMAFGLQDPTCPPHTNFAGYNIVSSEKKWYCVPTCGHAMWREESWSRERAEFFKTLYTPSL